MFVLKSLITIYRQSINSLRDIFNLLSYNNKKKLILVRWYIVVSVIHFLKYNLEDNNFVFRVYLTMLYLTTKQMY